MTETMHTPPITKPSTVSRADRLTSFELEDFQVPQGREEEWRFTPMRRVRPLFDVESYTGQADITVRADSAVKVDTVPRSEQAEGIALAPDDYPSAIAWDKFETTTWVTIPKDVEVKDPVYIQIVTAGDPAVARIVVEAEEHAKGTVIITHSGSGNFNETVEVRAGDGSNLSVVSVNDWERNVLMAGSHRMTVGRDATLRHMVVSLGGDVIRINVEDEFTAPGGELYMNGAYFVDAGQHMEHRVFLHHNKPNGYSRVAYKGALQGKNARSVWVGDCLIGKDADNTDTYELNRNLLLSEGAKADSIPNLEIENGEIEGAGHASATGRFDEEQLFYLMSRGVPPLEARRLVTRGFFAEILHEIGVPEVEDSIMSTIDNLLASEEEGKN